MFLGFLVFAGALVWWAGTVTPGTLAILCAATVIVTMIFPVWWPQAVLFDQSVAVHLKNCALCCIKYFPRTLGVAALQTALWILVFLFLPWTAFLVPFLGVWYILFLTVFRLEEQIDSQFPGQIPNYEDEEEQLWNSLPKP